MLLLREWLWTEHTPEEQACIIRSCMHRCPWTPRFLYVWTARPVWVSCGGCLCSYARADALGNSTVVAVRLSARHHLSTERPVHSRTHTYLVGIPCRYMQTLQPHSYVAEPRRHATLISAGGTAPLPFRNLIPANPTHFLFGTACNRTISRPEHEHKHKHEHKPSLMSLSIVSNFLPSLRRHQQPTITIFRHLPSKPPQADIACHCPAANPPRHFVRDA